MSHEASKAVQATLPHSPGIYKYTDDQDRILYVGKARDLKKRVSSYFQKEHDSARLRMLVRKIAKIEVTIVQTEQEALLLENSLIKQYQPKYNILLKDDKSYPFICIKNERYPRIFLTRRYINDGSTYLGPYTSVARVESILELIRGIFKIRTCSLNLSEKAIENGKYRVCLEYHIGNCAGPCENLFNEQAYNEQIALITKILKGQSNLVLNELKDRMKKYAEQMQFELANETKKHIETLQTFNSRTAVVNPDIDDVEVFTIAEEGEYAFVNYLKVMNGSIVYTRALELKTNIDETKEDLLVFAINEIRGIMHSDSKEVFVQFPIEYPDPNLKITVPQIGDKRKLVELSFKNAMFMKSKFLEEQLKRDYQKGRNRVLEQLQQDFRLTELPVHIECFDNSNIQGTNPVASMVVFKNGRSSKADYRHYNIKTVEGPNDFASMEEVVYRRYKRLTDEGLPLPQLVVIDGGKGQLSSTMTAIDKLGLRGKMAIVSIAKRLEEIYFPEDPMPLYINKRSESLKLIQQLRNEAHRFAITFHRLKRSNSTFKTGITEIAGIGEKTSQVLLNTFRSEKKIKAATKEELAAVVGNAKAEVVYKHYHSAS
jgi:excinuclease ABC subunit C